VKLIFQKKNPQTIEVKLKQNEDIQKFDYITMLKGLLDNGSLDDSELTGDFSEAEKTSITSMVKHLNDCVPLKDGQVYLDSDTDEGEVEEETGQGDDQ